MPRKPYLPLQLLMCPASRWRRRCLMIMADNFMPHQRGVLLSVISGAESVLGPMDCAYHRITCR